MKQLLSTAENQPTFAAQLYQGDISLPMTYWVFGVIIGFATQSINTIIELKYFDTFMVEQAVGWGGALLSSCITVGYGIFMTIAIWRSAGKYKGSAFWAWLARITTVLNAFILISILITFAFKSYHFEQTPYNFYHRI